MASCPVCGKELPGEFPFCPFCGADLATAAAVAREQRKVVTVLFCDVTGSTELGEKLDPEALRALLARYFERMKTIVERHGGSVEKFIGDAVMAVFGVPALHEDDALRAVRSAVEMRDFLFAFVALRFRITRTLRGGRLVAVCACAALVPVALAVPAIVALTLVAAVWVALHAYELIWYRAERSELRTQGLSASTS